jgi:hypothetical protein
MRFPMMLVLLAAAVVNATAALAADDRKIELRIFDVRDITSTVVDFPAPETRLARDFDRGVKSAFDNPEAPAVMQAADLQTLIKERLIPFHFAGVETSIEESGGKLIVMQTPQVHALIEKMIGNFRTIAKPQIVVRGLLLSAGEVPDETYFDDAAVAELQKNAKVLACPRVVCFNGQRTHVLSGRSINYTRDYDMSGNDYDPIVNTALEGSTFEVHPTLSSNRATVQVAVNFVFNSNVVIKTETFGLDASVGSVASAVLPTAESGSITSQEKTQSSQNSKVEGRVLGTQYAVGMELDFVSQDTNTVDTQVVIPSGKWVLASVMNDLKAKDRRLILLVTAEVLDKEEN